MRVMIFTVCQRAASLKGRLNIEGAFTNLVVPQLPARLSFSLAIRLFFSSEEEGSFSGTLEFITPDGVSLLKNNIELTVPNSMTDVTGVHVDSVGELATTLTTSGEYQFHIRTADGESHVFPFYVERESR